MSEVLEGSQEGMSPDLMLLSLADEFGANPSNTKFRGKAIRALNRALLRIAEHNPQLRRFVVHDADVTLLADTAVYDVADTLENGGWGWTLCREVLSVVVPSLSDAPLEMVKLDQWRRRGEKTETPGIPETCIVLDHRRVRIYPTPNTDSTGKGDYRQEVPAIEAGGGRVSWPAGWDEVALLGGEFYISRFLRPEMVTVLKADFEAALDSMRRGERVTGVRPSRAVATRNIRGQRRVPADNSTDWRR